MEIWTRRFRRARQVILGSSKPRSKFPAKKPMHENWNSRSYSLCHCRYCLTLNRNVLAPILAVDNYFPAYATLFEMSLRFRNRLSIRRRSYTTGLFPNHQYYWLGKVYCSVHRVYYLEAVFPGRTRPSSIFCRV